MAFISAKTTVTTSTSLTNKISAYAQKIVNNRIERVQDNIVLKVKDILYKAIVNSPVYLALTGKFPNSEGYDLQAELGLTDDRAKIAVDRLIEILLETVDITFEREFNLNKGSSVITIKVSALDENKYEEQLKNGAEFSYISRSKNKKVKKRNQTAYLIKWMKWLLELTHDVLSEYSITYDISGRDIIISRSRRAIMTKKKSRARFPYKFPTIAIPKNSGKNFIDEIAKDPRFRHLVNDSVKRIMLKTLKS